MARLIFFCGHAGAGKTTLAKQILQRMIALTGESFCLLDKDTLYGTYSAVVMGVLTGNPNDRDSQKYLDYLRDPEYIGLLDTARENLALGVNTMVVGPFSREVKAKDIFDPTWLGLPGLAASKVVWVHIPEDIAYQRIVGRGDMRDEYKLEHWDEYRLRRFEPKQAEYPEMIFYDNTQFDLHAVDALAAKLV